MIGPLSRLGKKHAELLVKWIPSASIFGGAGACFGLYVTEWRLISEWIPFYGGKFNDEN